MSDHCESLYYIIVQVCVTSLCMFVSHHCASLCHIIVKVCVTSLCKFVSHHCACLCLIVVKVCVTSLCKFPSIPCSVGLIPFENIFIQMVLLKIEMCRNTLHWPRHCSGHAKDRSSLSNNSPSSGPHFCHDPPSPDPPYPKKEKEKSLAMLIIRGK